MTIIQLLISSVAVIGVVVVVLLAVIPALLDYPGGHDQEESDPPVPSPLRPDDHDHDIDLAA